MMILFLYFWCVEQFGMLVILHLQMDRLGVGILVLEFAHTGNYISCVIFVYFLYLDHAHNLMRLMICYNDFHSNIF